MHTHFHVHALTHTGFRRTIVWAVTLCVLVVTAVSLLGRATHNFQAALTEKPDVAIYLLLPDAGIRTTTVLKESEIERDYLAETEDGPKLIRLKKGPNEWFVSLVEDLHEKE